MNVHTRNIVTLKPRQHYIRVGGTKSPNQPPCRRYDRPMSSRHLSQCRLLTNYAGKDSFVLYRHSRVPGGRGLYWIAYEFRLPMPGQITLPLQRFPNLLGPALRLQTFPQTDNNQSRAAGTDTVLRVLQGSSIKDGTINHLEERNMAVGRAPRLLRIRAEKKRRSPHIVKGTQ